MGGAITVDGLMQARHLAGQLALLHRQPATIGSALNCLQPFTGGRTRHRRMHQVVAVAGYLRLPNWGPGPSVLTRSSTPGGLLRDRPPPSAAKGKAPAYARVE